ncbi:hypothetical protein AB0K14_26100 [Actinosynnema sp. NPDC050801]
MAAPTGIEAHAAGALLALCEQGVVGDDHLGPDTRGVRPEVLREHAF